MGHSLYRPVGTAVIHPAVTDLHGWLLLTEEFPQKISGSFFSTVSGSQFTLVVHLKMLSFSSITPSKDRASCEVKRIGATGVGILLFTRTTACVGARTAQLG